jgi:hypothetical protein
LSFYRVLARLAGQVVLGIAVFLWGVIALLDVEHASLRPWFGVGCVAAAIGLAGLFKGWRWSSWPGAIGLMFPIGVLAHANGASPWLWLFWVACAVATERWLRDGITAPPMA